MNRRQGSILFAAGLILLLLAVLALPAGAKSDKPVVLSFDMWAIEPGATAYAGSVTGSVSGDLSTHQMCALRSQHKSCQGVLLKWEISNAGGKSFTAVTRGLCHLESGVMRLSGEVTAGYMAGARLTARGRLYDAQAGHYRGLITIYENLEIAEPLQWSQMPLEMYVR